MNSLCTEKSLVTNKFFRKLEFAQFDLNFPMQIDFAAKLILFHARNLVKLIMNPVDNTKTYVKDNLPPIIN